jgi:hypothetical protein
MTFPSFFYFMAGYCKNKYKEVFRNAGSRRSGEMGKCRGRGRG